MLYYKLFKLQFRNVLVFNEFKNIGFMGSCNMFVTISNDS